MTARVCIGVAALLLLTTSVNVHAENVTVGEITSRQMSRPDSSGDVWYAVKAPVENLTDEHLIVGLSLQALDRDGFELDDLFVVAVIPPRAARSLTDKSFMSAAMFRSIDRWQVKEQADRGTMPPSVSVTEIKAKMLGKPDRSGDVWFAVKADVHNQGEFPIDSVQVQALDEDGFELEELRLAGSVKAGAKATLSEKSYMAFSNFAKIAEWVPVEAP